MEEIRKLLSVKQSVLSKNLQLGLHGLKAQLQEAARLNPKDAGSEACAELISAINKLLVQPTGLVENKPLQNKPIQKEESQSDLDDIFGPKVKSFDNAPKIQLQPLVKMLSQDRDILTHFGNVSWSANSDE